MHQFAGTNSFTSLEYLKRQLDTKIRELTVSGKIILHKGATTVSMASEIIQEKSIVKRMTVPKVEEFVQNVTPEEIQAYCDAKEKQIQKNAQIKSSADTKRLRSSKTKTETTGFGSAQVKT